MTRVLIIGVASAGGAYLARLLQARGQQVWGAVAGPGTDLSALDDLGVRTDIALLEYYGDVRGLLDEARADHIYDLRAGLGGDPDAVIEGCRQLLDAPRSLSSKLFIGGSGEVFGDTGGCRATEATPFAPETAAGLATAGIAELVERSRSTDARFAATGFLFDHASRFGPRGRALEIIAATHAISIGQAETMTLDDADDERDWGWTPEYVDAMRRMLEMPEPRDQIIATGTRLTVRAFASHAFDYFRVDGDRLSGTLDLSRSARTSLGDPATLARDTGWRAYTHGRDLVDTLCEGFAATLAP